METTRFEITMIIDVVDVGDVQASSGVLHDSVIKAVEGISTGNVVKVIEANTSQKTFPIEKENKPDLTTHATEGYMCSCGQAVHVGTELHICQGCGTKHCPRCSDYSNKFCEECCSTNPHN